jgi:hypothetical protein
VLSKQLYLCQFTVALGIVRVGGHFVCKVFDVFTPFRLERIKRESEVFVPLPTPISLSALA